MRRFLTTTVALLSTTASSVDGQASEMVDVGDRSLEVFRAGSGTPTVVLEAPLGFTAESWRLVFPHVAEITSVLSYSRAGLGNSTPSAGGSRVLDSVGDLRELLVQVDAEYPVVLVGHSIGGLLARTYATLYPAEVAGLVLVDGTHERQYLEIAEVVDGFWNLIAETTELMAAERGEAVQAEWAAWLEVAQIGELPVVGELPNVPMAVITALRPEEGSLTETAEGRRVWRRLHDELFSQTTNGLRLVTTRSGHLIPDSEPMLVVDAVRWVVDRVRTEGGR